MCVCVRARETAAANLEIPRRRGMPPLEKVPGPCQEVVFVCDHRSLSARAAAERTDRGVKSPDTLGIPSRRS